MGDALEIAIQTAKNFEKALIMSNMTPNKVYQTKVYLKDIPKNKDLSEFLLEIIENSKKFTTHLISSRVFTIENDGRGEFIKLSCGYYDGRLDLNEVYVPFTANFDDYLTVTSKK